MGIFSVHKPAQCDAVSEGEPREPVSETGRAPGEGAAKVRYPKLAPDAPLSLIGPDGSLLGRARLLAYSPWSLTLGRLPGETDLPVFEKGTAVRVQGRSDSLEPFTMRAGVAESGPVELRLDRLEPLDDLERRSAFRHGVWAPAELLSLDGREPPEIWPCQLTNISRTGACVVGAEAFAEGTRLRLRTELARGLGQISFHGKVIRRRALPDGRTEHGLLLAEMTKEKKARLMADLRAMQEAAEEAARR